MSELRNPLLIIIVSLSMAIGSSQLTRGHEWGDDFASYIMQAKSILNGETQEFIQHNTLTIFESSFQIGPIAYPWGYPLILTPAYALKGLSPLPLKLPGLFSFAGFLICLYLLMKTRLTPPESLLIVSLFAFNPMLLGFLDQVLSDIPFLFFSTLALLMMNEKKRGILDFALLGGVISFAFFVRTTGILLLAIFLSVELFKAWSDRTNPETTKPILQNVIAVCGIFGMLWGAYALLFPGGSESYFAQLRDFEFETALRFTGDYLQLFSQFFGATVIWKIFYYFLVVFFLAGLWKRRKEDANFFIFFFIWMAHLITWPIWQGQRFVFPLLPIFVYFAFQGMKTFINKLDEKYQQTGKKTIYVFWFLVAGIFLFNSTASAYTNLQNNRSINGPFDPYSMEVYAYIKEKTLADSVIIFFKPRAMRLFTDRDTIMSTECERLLLGDHIVISKKAENSQIPPGDIHECGIPLNDVFENRRFIVYEILK